MKKRNPIETLIQRAVRTVPGFAAVWKKFERQVVTGGYSRNTLTNYGRSVAQIALYFKRNPLEVDEEQIQEYLFTLAQKKGNSESYFKFAVYGLRYLYRLYGMDSKRVELPVLRKKKTLPAVLSKEECRMLFRAPKLLKHRVLLAFTYSSGMRMNEVRTVLLADIDSDRMQIRVRQGKGRKDRYVVLSKLMLTGLRKYYLTCKPVKYLFNGGKQGGPLGPRSLQWILNEAIKKTRIKKQVTLHTLRHSFATHLLEDGVDLYTIKEQLGHERIETTLTYLHIARVTRPLAHSPLDTLYEVK